MSAFLTVQSHYHTDSRTPLYANYVGHSFLFFFIFHLVFPELIWSDLMDM